MPANPLLARAIAISGSALLLLAACGGEADKTPAKAAGDASGLTAYVGKYPFDPVNGISWNDHPAVKAGLAATVTDAKVLSAITTTEGPSGPIENKGGKLVSWSCQAHNCGAHQWSIQIAPATGATDVCYFDEKASATEARWFLAGGKEEKRAGECQ